MYVLPVRGSMGGATPGPVLSSPMRPIKSSTYAQRKLASFSAMLAMKRLPVC
jgi:hypothetical protein